MLQQFEPGDILIFQLEAGYALLRVLAIEGDERDPIWHVAGYSDLFLDVESADEAISNYSSLTLAKSHLAITNRAFESTQVAKMANVPITEAETATVDEWRGNPNSEASDKSVRLLLGLR